MISQWAMTILANITDSESVAYPVYNTVVPQNKTFPAIVVNQPSVAVAYEKSTPSVVQNNIRLQVDIYAPYGDKAEEIATIVRGKLELKHGTIENRQFNFITMDGYQASHEEALNLHRVSMDFNIPLK